MLKMSDTDSERKEAVRKAWSNEKSTIMQGNGTRNWTQREQIEMVRKNQVHGYHGHHMKSVKDYPNQAGNPKNIQFLKRDEHIYGAHKGNTKNSTNGYYNPVDKSMNSFGNRPPQAPVNKLSSPLSQNQINSAVKREQTLQNRMTHDRRIANQWRVNNGYSPMFPQKKSTSPSQNSTNKAINKMRAQTQNSQPNTTHTTSPQKNTAIQNFRQYSASKSANCSQTGKSTNQAIKNFQNNTPSGTSNTSTNTKTSGPSKSSGQKK